MPGRQIPTRRVNFASHDLVSRLPHDDEKCVMEAFARHASHCSICAHPYSVHLSGGTLCDKGHKRALDVAQYVYSIAGRACSVVDGGDGDRAVRIEIPAGCDAVRGLLMAMESGLRLRRAEKPQSFDRTYDVGPRPVIIEEMAPRARKAGYTARAPKPAGKGSLYEEDMKERVRRAKKAVYYKVEERVPRRR
ncbi:MAG: hypothetical protein FRX48_02840 [Lasallia pustulata]|uniref:Uncharacterized protein n=1 Tax=Lasallia pustulata TaxID=136370 RepID=A0A5M8PUL8_9LECA|nr:MAG: hypothetical protein FRX48_02840 [Lasallia pustulata]